MKLNYKNREFIIKVCENCTSYAQARKVSEILIKFAESKRIKKVVNEVVGEFNALCLCEVVGQNRESKFEQYSKELALKYIKAIDENDEKVYNMFKLNVERSMQNGNSIKHN